MRPGSPAKGHDVGNITIEDGVLRLFDFYRQLLEAFHKQIVNAAERNDNRREQYRRLRRSAVEAGMTEAELPPVMRSMKEERASAARRGWTPEARAGAAERMRARNAERRKERHDEEPTDI